MKDFDLPGAILASIEAEETGMADTRMPNPGELWWKPSYPFPTIVEITPAGEQADGPMVHLRYNGRRRNLPLGLFLGQGFRKWD